MNRKNAIVPANPMNLTSVPGHGGRALEQISTADFESLGYERLHDLLLYLIRGCQNTTFVYDAATRRALLPALTAMKRLTTQPGRRIPDQIPSYEEECILLGLSAALVRKWKRKTATDLDLRFLLGEKPLQPRTKTQIPSVEYRRLKLLVESVISGDLRRVEELAHRWHEEYER
ncbi:hypothetical protein [Occallatibacter savannae]|uniref:hypothetical protein n=1 Tax=Occallatibacter savannae TaxID=1002691 RepID=UPI0013A5402E|nr:hypothetical protein [Occallatibacter savannae]